MLGLKEMRCLELNAMSLGIDEEALMENAGRAVARETVERYGSDGVVVVCGTGNNGGDGFVVAREIPGSEVVLAKPPERIRTDLAKKKFREWAGDAKVFRDGGGKMLLDGAKVIVDALLGTGTTGELKEPYGEIIDAINGSGAKVVSVDAPSGLWSSRMVRPDLTVTFHDSKKGMEDIPGETVVADIGIPEDASVHTGPGEFAFYPHSPGDAHKGQMGRVLVVGGGPFPGAPVLSALGAMKAGADLVTLLVPGSSCPFASHHPELIVKELPSSNRIEMSALERIMDEIERCDVILMGPGVGQVRDTVDALKTVINSASKPMVIDADGLKALRDSTDLLIGKTGILTPHKKEFEILAGSTSGDDIRRRVEAVKWLSGKVGMTVLFKAPVDIIAHVEEHRLNSTGCPAMAVGGTGDVLAGLCAGFMARGMDSFKAARLASYVNGMAGEEAFKRYSYSMGPVELLEFIPGVLRNGLSQV